MSDAQWGSLEGDYDAEAISRDRKASRGSAWFMIVGYIALAGFLIWLGMGGGDTALAWSLGVAFLLLGEANNNVAHPTHTFVMIAEQRIRRCESMLQEIRDHQSRR